MGMDIDYFKKMSVDKVLVAKSGKLELFNEFDVISIFFNYKTNTFTYSHSTSTMESHWKRERVKDKFADIIITLDLFCSGAYIDDARSKLFFKTFGVSYSHLYKLYSTDVDVSTHLLSEIYK
jgi:hypothetical protein